MSIHVEKYRSQMPIFKNHIQLSSCSQSAMHQKVKDSVLSYMTSWEEGGMDWGGWMQQCEEARQKFARLINADPEEISVVSSVSHAVSAIANSLPRISDRDEVVLSDMDFPCVGHAWLSQPDVKVNFISAQNNRFTLDQYESAVNKNTLLTSLSHILYYNGFKQNIKNISDVVHAKGSYLFVDAYQSAGQVDIDVKRDGIDMLATGMQKYLLGIPGIAFMYVKKEIAEQLTPAITGWFGQANPFAFDVQNVEYAPGAVRFDTGTFPMLNGYTANAALDILLEVGIPNIEAHLLDLSRYSLNYAQEKDLTIRSPLNPKQKGSNTALYVKNASEVEQKMKERGYIVSARNDVVRIAPHFYNTKEDIKGAIDCFAEVTK